MEKWYPAAAEYIRSHRNEIIDDLKELARIPSISKAGKDGLPFGKEVDDVLNAAAAIFNRNGVPMEVRHMGGYAVGELKGEGDGIGIFGHADVVPVNDDWIKTTPFAPIEEDGFLFGRGVSDNKAGVIGGLYALLALKAAGVGLKNRVSVFVGGSEETGMHDMANYVANEHMPAVSLVPDGSFPVSVGEKGILRVDCRSKIPLENVKKLNGGHAYNVILDRVAVELSDGTNFTVEGLTSHAANPEGSVNAGYKAAEKLLEMPICENDKCVLNGLKESIRGYYGEELNIASEGVFGKLTCANGIIKVEEDGHLFFTLDIRYGSEVDDKKMIENIIESLDSKGFVGKINENDPGFLLDEGGAAMEIVLGSCREVCEMPEAEPYKMYGGTYARKLKNAYTMSHSAPCDEKLPDLPAGHGGAHQSDEYLSIEGFLKGICCMALIIGRLDEELSK